MSWAGSNLGPGERVQFLQAQLFPVCTFTATQGFIGNFLSKSLKTNQIEVNTDEKTLKPIARLKEPRDLFALPKNGGDNECPQQAARWPVECQVLDERVHHVESNPATPELYNQPSGSELKPRPVGEENGVIVYNYNPVSAVNYMKGDSDGSDSEISSGESRCSSPGHNGVGHSSKLFTKKFTSRSSSTSDFVDTDEDYDDDDIRNLNKRKVGGGKPTLHLDNDIFETAQMKKMIGTFQKVPEPHLITPPQSKTARLFNNCTTSLHLDTDVIDEINEQNCSKNIISEFNNDIININQSTNNNDNNDNSNIVALITNTSAQQAQLHTPLANNINININNNNSNCNNDGTTLQFSRSSVGGSKFLTNCHPAGNSIDPDYESLEFESRFESGNLAKAVKITQNYYELYLRPDLYTNRHKQWFYFRVKNTKKNILYRFSIVNLVKSDSLYNEGMKPLMYSTINAKIMDEGWRRCGENIAYYSNDANTEDEDDNSSYTLSFHIKFPHDNDVVYFAHSYPYTYSDLQDYLMEIQRHPIKSKYCKLRLLCRSLAGNNVYYLTVTAQATEDDANKVRKKMGYVRRKKAIVVSARVHPGETPSSWMMKGFMDFITGDSNVAKRLRHKFIFKLIPMLNPDGVIVGNTRNSLTGKDLNRQYRTVIRETYPTIWYTKAMIKRLIDECGVAMYCDMHAHSRRHNIFIYGCENRRCPERKLCEQVFPLMVHKNCADKFSFESCRFKVHRNKEGTGRIVMWMFGVMNSYTVEASFGGSSLGSRNGTHFSAAEQLKLKIIERLIREGSSADGPLNIPLTDYSSDDGDSTSSSSENEGKSEGPCCKLTAPPCSPDITNSNNGIMDTKQGRKVLLKMFDKIIKRNLKLGKKMKSTNLEKNKTEIEEKTYNEIKRLHHIVLDLSKGKKKVLRRKMRNITNMYLLNRKLKIKSSDQVHRRRTKSRTTLELPTTNPGSDAHFSTDDELSISDGYCTVPQCRRAITQFDMRRLATNNNNDQHELQQTNDNNNKMPPELIVTTSANNKKKLNINNLNEFPPISANNRTNSWHNLHKKCVPKVRVQNINNLTELNNELSLKKKIWTGVSPINRNDKNRPLSWGIPPIQKNNNKEIFMRDYDPEALLAACSQKLISMQGSSDVEYHQSETENQSQLKNKVLINLSLEMAKSTTSTTVAGVKKVKNNKITSKIKKQSETSIIAAETKHKKKRNNTSKYEDSKQLLIKSRGRNSLTRKLSSTSALSILGTSTNQIYLAPINKGQQKFKTSGIVATATVQSNYNNNHNNDNNNNNNNSNSNKKINKNNVPPSKLPTNLQQIQLKTNIDCYSTNLDNEHHQFSKKTRNKIKRKKSKTNN